MAAGGRAWLGSFFLDGRWGFLSRGRGMEGLEGWFLNSELKVWEEELFEGKAWSRCDFYFLVCKIDFSGVIY